jgi:hypothetical protein
MICRNWENRTKSDALCVYSCARLSVAFGGTASRSCPVRRYTAFPNDNNSDCDIVDDVVVDVSLLLVEIFRYLWFRCYRVSDSLKKLIKINNFFKFFSFFSFSKKISGFKVLFNIYSEKSIFLRLVIEFSSFAHKLFKL